MKNSVLDRLKSYFNEYFMDATKPTARNLFLIAVSILALDIFRSVRFAHSHVLSKLSNTSLNAYYYALKTDALNLDSWRNVTLSKALKAVPDPLNGQLLFLSIDDTMVEKEGKKFDLCARLFDHAAHNGFNYLNGHCMVSILLSFPVLADGSIRYLSVPLGYRLWENVAVQRNTERVLFMSKIMEKDNLMNNVQPENAYLSIRSYVIDAQKHVYSAVNAAMVTAYWNIGKAV